ncbi:cytidylyltransferase domain-containing protein [Vibrio chagasii]|uniref:acylneuraminate cytidylyltransferase family protein n=1 Tax=Vibrio chagasii TaxID=170679 RepID=UPI002284E8D5|nr:acylneuraminate cytidylyltransferase family protein [Vibrio chagasii]MCY9826428.1 acylneuraminate cytidylyltransferase family protein [Vibrio chagasii]
MINGKKVLGIIPARKGSKRLPGKNIMSFAGKPLISWTIEAALLSKYIDRVIVSTDCCEIKECAIKAGATVPFIRPSYLSSDSTSSFDVVAHALKELEKEEMFSYVVLLQPTSPLRTSEHIDQTFDLLIDKQGDAVVSVCEAEHSPLWSNTLPESLSMDGFLRTEADNKRSQDLPKYYRLNGAIYLVSKKCLLEKGSFLPDENCFAFVMPQEESVDIDTSLDFKVAELIAKEK